MYKNTSVSYIVESRDFKIQNSARVESNV